MIPGKESPGQGIHEKLNRAGRIVGTVGVPISVGLGIYEGFGVNNWDKATLAVGAAVAFGVARSAAHRNLIDFPAQKTHTATTVLGDEAPQHLSKIVASEQENEALLLLAGRLEEDRMKTAADLAILQRRSSSSMKEDVIYTAKHRKRPSTAMTELERKRNYLDLMIEEIRYNRPDAALGHLSMEINKGIKEVREDIFKIHNIDINKIERDIQLLWRFDPVRANTYLEQLNQAKKPHMRGY